jgi:uncharacterized membrane protein
MGSLRVDLMRALAGGAIAYLAVSFWRRMRSRTGPESNDSRTLDELWERYERGEISWDEYEALSRDLKE